MSVYLYRWGKLAYRRKWIVLAVWLVAFISLGALSGTIGGKFKDDFNIPGMPSERATKILDAQFPGFSEEFKFDAITGTYVIKAPEGQLITSPENRARVQAIVDKLNNFNTNKRDQLNFWAGVADKLPQDQKDKNAELIRGLKESQEKFKDDQSGLKVDTSRAKLENPIATAEEMGCFTGDRNSQEFMSKCSNAPVNVLNKTSPDTVVTVAAKYKATLKDGKQGTMMELTDADRDAVVAVGDEARKAGLQVEIAGPVAMKQTMPGGTAELLGFLVAFVVMVVAFGALIAAFVPLITAMVGLVSAMTLITIGAGAMEIPSFTTFLCSMVGIALSIDYALFIVSRYKHELHVCATPEEAAGKSVGTAGTAVVFAGLTVIIALSGLAIVNIRFLTFMGLGGALAAAFAVLVAITLMPALLGVFGRFLFKPKIPGVAKYDPEDDTHVTNGMRVGKVIGRFPGLILGVAVVLLGLLALPALNLSLGMPGEDAMPESTTTRKAYELRTTGFGEGSNGTLMVAVDLSAVPQDKRDAALKALQQKLRLPEMDYVTDPMRNKVKGADPQDKNAPDGDGALIYGVPKHGPNNKDTKELVKNARGAEQELKNTYGIEYGITGSTAIYADIDHAMLSKIAPYMAVVAGAAFLLLILVFRSILVPLTAALGFLLSMAATFGATVLIFQEGRLGIISDPHPIVSFMPIMLIGLVFGLAMDYQVFLVTRMREEYVHGKNPKDAMISGYHHGARVVTSAAIIMISVFSAFILESDVTVKSMGFALAVAVLLDAFVVRMVIMPALLALLGKWAWWIPSWLDKILPDIDIEGSKLAALQPTVKQPVAESPSLAK